MSDSKGLYDSTNVKRVPAAPFVDRLGAIATAYFPDQKLDIRYKKKNKSYVTLSNITTYMTFRVFDDGHLDVEFGDSFYESDSQSYESGKEMYFETFKTIESLYESDTDFSTQIQAFHSIYGEDGNAPGRLKQFLSAIWYIVVLIFLYWLSYIL